ncbi:hypothetical protein D3C72_1884250 [compost metagenome]
MPSANMAISSERVGTRGIRYDSGIAQMMNTRLTVKVPMGAWSAGRPAAFRTVGNHDSSMNQATQFSRYTDQIASVLRA